MDNKLEIEKLASSILDYANVTDKELIDNTPKRFKKAWCEMLSGYQESPEDILGVKFENSCKGIVVIKDIDFYSTCEHHLLPFFGKVSIAYLPKDEVVGLSKLVRLVQALSKRLQIQERLTSQIAEEILKNTDAEVVGVIVKGKHMCMCSRGAKSDSNFESTYFESNDEYTNSILLQLLKD